MRVSKAQQARNREQVIAVAAKLLRERGIEGIGVDALATMSIIAIVAFANARRTSLPCRVASGPIAAIAQPVPG